MAMLSECPMKDCLSKLLAGSQMGEEESADHEVEAEVGLRPNERPQLFLSSTRNRQGDGVPGASLSDGKLVNHVAAGDKLFRSNYPVMINGNKKIPLTNYTNFTV